MTSCAAASYVSFQYLRVPIRHFVKGNPARKGTREAPPPVTFLSETTAAIGKRSGSDRSTSLSHSPVPSAAICQ